MVTLELRPGPQRADFVAGAALCGPISWQAQYFVDLVDLFRGRLNLEVQISWEVQRFVVLFHGRCSALWTYFLFRGRRSTLDLELPIAWQVQHLWTLRCRFVGGVQRFVDLFRGRCSTLDLELPISWQVQHLWTLRCRFRGMCAALCGRVRDQKRIFNVSIKNMGWVFFYANGFFLCSQRGWCAFGVWVSFFYAYSAFFMLMVFFCYACSSFFYAPGFFFMLMVSFLMLRVLFLCGTVGRGHVGGS